MFRRHHKVSSARPSKPASIEGLEDRRLLSGSLGHLVGIADGILDRFGIPTGGDFHFGHTQVVVGNVVSVDATADTITVSNPVHNSSSTTTYTLASSATITANGSTTTLASLLAGANVALQLDSSGDVTSITAISQHASGTISSVDATANTITITGFDGNDTTYPVGSSATIELNGSTSTLAGLTTGAVADLTLSALDAKTVTEINAHSFTLFGHGNLSHHISATVVSVDTSADTITVSRTNDGSTTQTTYTIDPSATITADGATTPLSSLLAGAQVQLTVSSSSSTTVTAIAASSQHVFGTVTAVDTTANTITLTQHGTATTYPIGTGATITVNGTTATLATITTGSSADLKLSALDDKTVTNIADRTPVTHIQVINATVVSVDTTADTITVSTINHGTTTQTTYTLDPSATITANGTATTLGSLLAGAKVRLQTSATSSTTVTSINAVSQEVEGTVSSVDTTANTITITTGLGSTTTTYTLGASAVLMLNGATATLSAFVAGTRVDLTLSALDGATVTQVNGRTPQTIVHHRRVAGTVTSVDTTANTITLSNFFFGSTTTTYTLGAGATITADGTTATLAQLTAGAKVVLQLTTTAGTTTVTSIAALQQRAAGSVTSVDTTANTITITPRFGTAQTYPLGTGATITLNGTASTLASLTAGTHAQLTLSALDGKTVLSIRAHH